MEGYLGLLVGFATVLFGFGVAFYALWLNSQSRRLKHQERMSMIEKGLVPPDVIEPAGPGASFPATRAQRRSGVFMICLGLAVSLMFLATSGWRTVWIGGFLVLFGVASLVNALLDERDRRRAPRLEPPPAPGGGAAL